MKLEKKFERPKKYLLYHKGSQRSQVPICTGILLIFRKPHGFKDDFVNFESFNKL